MTDTIIENIVASTQVSDSFDISLLAEKLPGSSYNPDEFNGLTIKFESPKIAILILSNGKLICTGGKNEEEIKNAIEKTVKRIKEAGFNIKRNYKIKYENIVASTDLHKTMDLEKISKGLPIQNVTYEPSEFPGVIYKVDDSIILLFGSGKIVCTGAKKIEDSTKAIDLMKEKLTSIGVL